MVKFARMKKSELAWFQLDFEFCLGTQRALSKVLRITAFGIKGNGS